MDQIELFRQIVASCDEALKDVFLRRMEASVRIAQSKFQEGVPVYSARREEQLLDTPAHSKTWTNTFPISFCRMAWMLSSVIS